MLDFAELREWTSERLSRFKVPRFWQAVEALPRTPTSRVAKHRLPTGHQPDEYDAEAAGTSTPKTKPDNETEDGP
jgi:crotonobetaine/carnitine-CoA ligase